MFKLFASAPFEDTQLGELRRSRGNWKGTLRLKPCGSFVLSLAGDRSAPDPIALNLAKELPGRFDSLKPEIRTGLLEHYEPYLEAWAAGEEMPGEPPPNLANPESIWDYIKPAHVLIGPFGGIPTVEIAFLAAWDQEHTVAARFQAWKFIELNGSVRGQ